MRIVISLALHCYRSSEAGRVVGVIAHRQIERDNRLAGRHKVAFPHGARRRRCGRGEQEAVKTFGYSVLNLLDLFSGIEIRSESLELEAVLIRCRLKPGAARGAIGVLATFGQISDAVNF